MTRERESRGANDTNAQIITTDNGRIYRPRNLLNAISEVQQFYTCSTYGVSIESRETQK